MVCWEGWGQVGQVGSLGPWPEKAVKGSPDGKIMLEKNIKGSVVDAESLGIELAKQLLAAGAGDILKAVYDA